MKLLKSKRVVKFYVYISPIFSCRVTYIICSKSSLKHLNFCIIVLPSIKTPLDNTTIVIHEGMNRTFTCEATGYPIPNVTWHRVDGLSIDVASMSDNILTGDGSVITNLTITNASRKDTGGIYLCSQ